jgi:RHS repeat-associated protein
MKTTVAIFRLSVFVAVLAIICIVSSAFGDILSWQVAYDDQGRIARQIDPAGRIKKFTYTPTSGGPVQTITATPPQGPPVIWKFDQNAKLSSMKDGAGVVTYQYDSYGRVSVVARKGAAVIHYSYDADGRLTELRVGDFYRVKRAYDFLGRIATIDTPAGRICYEYLTGQGIVVRKLPNGIKTFWKRRPTGQLDKITHSFHKKPDDDSNNMLLASYRYGYSHDGRIATIHESSRQGETLRQYNYDTMGRLIHASGPEGRQYSYEYDMVGNRVKATATGHSGQICTYDWAGRLTTVNGNPVKYDTSGNLIMATFGGFSRNYYYKSDGQLAKAKVGSKIVQYYYDGFGRMIRRKTSDGETRFEIDQLSLSWKPIIIDGQDGVRTLVIWDGTVPLAFIRQKKVEWFLHDHIGSVRLVAGKTGKVKQYRDYDPFGKTEKKFDSAFMKPGFGGLLWDGDSQGYFTLARIYIPGLGGFLQPDPQKRIPVGSVEDNSLYSYCGGDPIGFVDRDGAARQKAGGQHIFEQVKESIKWSVELLNPKWEQYFKTEGNKEAYDRLCGYAWGKARKKAILDYGVLNREALVTDFHEIVYGFRHRNVPIPKEVFDGMQEPPIEKEVKKVLQLAENYALKLRFGMTGKVLDGLETMSVNPSKAILHGEARGWGWSLLHYLGERSGDEEPGYRFSGTRAVDLAIALSDKKNYPTFTSKYNKAKEIWGAKQKGEAWESQNYETHSAHLRGLRDVILLKTLGIEPQFKFAPNVSVSKFDYYTSSGKRIVGTSSFSTSYFRIHGVNSKIKRYQARYNESLDGPALSKAVERYNKTGIWEYPRKTPGSAGAAIEYHKSLHPSPSTVGGVYLGGAGKTIDGLGHISGVSIDQNSNLVLLGHDGGAIDLPPLRLDDVITIFRSVYLHGEGPTVTIDPASENPEASAMVIRHGKATEETYVGWVLYEADRLMKGYTLGVDNKTGKDVVTQVTGYDKVLETMYFSGANSGRALRKKQWERFWIVPDQARRFEGPLQALTLLDMPLKVKTQLMKWEHGKLVDDLSGRSSQGALYFTDWFTDRYHQIDQERFLTPPPESGITAPVPVFSELRRIALITAIAEKLRDQGVPMPFWMFDYKVQPVPFEKITPALRVTRSNGRVKSRVFGGVQLSPASADIKIFKANADLAGLTQHERRKVQKRLALAKGLENTLERSGIQVPPLKPEKLSYQGQQYQVVSMPGADTLVLGPLRMVEADISVPLPGVRTLELARHHNSFFAPKGAWGKGWTMDLPRLVEFKQPLIRKGSQVRYRTAYELITPLNSVRTRFSKIEKVAALNNAELLVPDMPDNFLGMTQEKPDFLTVATRVLVLNNGARWHFSDAGHLVAVVDSGLITVYERDASGRVTRIVGLLGRQKVGEIELAYDKAGRLRSAEGKNAEVSTAVEYVYTGDGKLQLVKSNLGQVGYHYKEGRLAKITRQEAKKGTTDFKETTLRSFAYNTNGQLVREVYGDGMVLDYHWTSGAQGATAAVGDAADGQVVRFDAAMRPVHAQNSDGTQVKWRYPQKSVTQMEISGPDQTAMVVTTSADKRRVTLKAPNAPTIVAQKGAAGRLVSVTEDGKTLLTQHWQADGRLERVETPTANVWYDYDRDGLVASLLIAPAGQSGTFKRFRKVKVDASGRAVEIKDHTGLHKIMQYGKAGEIVAAVDKSSGKHIGYTVDRDKHGRVRSVNSSWGSEKYSYDPEGGLRQIGVQRQGKSAAVEFEGGQIRKLRQFDGGETALSYYGRGPHEGLLRQVQSTNGLELVYKYDDAARLIRVDVGGRRQVVLDYDTDARVVNYTWRRLAMKTSAPKQSSSPFEPVLKRRITDNKSACNELSNAIVLDLYKHNDGKISVNIQSSNGDSLQMAGARASDLVKMIRASFAANRSQKIEAKWEAFCRQHLSDLASPERKSLPSGAEIKIKPILIIKSNMVDHRYANLKKIPALRDNFNIFIASRKGSALDPLETSASEIAEKINAIPPLTRENVVFAIRPPKEGATKEIQAQWKTLVGELRELVGRDSVVFNPDKKSFGKVFTRKDKDIIVIEITHTAEGIRLKGEEEFKTADVNKLGDLSRVKLLIGGNSCRLPRLDNGKFAKALLNQGVGIINGTYDTVPHDTIVQRMQLFKIILEHAEKFNIPAIYLQDIIDQATSIPERDKGTTNLGKIETKNLDG